MFGKGFAFVVFDTVENATAARTALTGRPIRGLPIKINYGRVRVRFFSLSLSLYHCVTCCQDPVQTGGAQPQSGHGQPPVHVPGPIGAPPQVRFWHCSLC